MKTENNITDKNEIKLIFYILKLTRFSSTQQKDDPNGRDHLFYYSAEKIIKHTLPSLASHVHRSACVGSQTEQGHILKIRF